MLEKWFQSLGQEDPLEKEMATPSSILAWEISWTEEPSPWCWKRIEHDLATKQQIFCCSSPFISSLYSFKAFWLEAELKPYVSKVWAVSFLLSLFWHWSRSCYRSSTYSGNSDEEAIITALKAQKDRQM